jgi:hypothetical protein
MKASLTTTLDQTLLDFLGHQAKVEQVNRNTILERALKLYKNLKLEMAVKEGLKDRQGEYKSVAKNWLVPQKYALRHLK